MKFRNFTFEGGRKQTTTKFFFLFVDLESGIRIRLHENMFFCGS